MLLRCHGLLCWTPNERPPVLVDTAITMQQLYQCLQVLLRHHALMDQITTSDVDILSFLEEVGCLKKRKTQLLLPGSSKAFDLDSWA